MLDLLRQNYKNAIIIISSLISGLIISFILSTDILNATELHQSISKELIRFHVIANSDTKEDQALKLTVKDGVVLTMKDLLEDSKNVNETRKIISDNLELINNKALQIIKEKGYSYTVNVYLTHCYFPIKTYGDITLPAGEYEALRIEIGKAQGENWWCIMFPPLCFIDATHGVVNEESREQLQNILTEEEYYSITKEEDIPIKVRFKVIKVIKEYFKKNN